jgi:dysferlin
MNKDHELYRMWVAMTDTTDETQGINAFLKLSINVLGPGDKPPVHDASKNFGGKNDNGLTKLFTPGRVKMSGHIIKFNIYRAEHLAPLDLVSNNVDPYFKISFAGTKAESKTVDDDRNPEFNQELALACRLPCMNGKIKIEVWDDDMAFDKRVGTHYLNFKQI